LRRSADFDPSAFSVFSNVLGAIKD